MNKYLTLIKDTFIFALGSVGSKIILFFLVPLYTNYLSTEEYGIADLVFTIAQLIIPIVSVVIFDAVLRFGLSKEEKRENVLLVGLLVCFIGSIAALCFLPLSNLYEPISAWKWYLYIYVIFSMVQSVEMNYLKIKDLNKLYALFSIIQTLVMALLNIMLLVVYKTGIKGYLLSNIVASVLICFLAFIFGELYKDIKLAEFDKSLFRKMVYFSAPLIFNNLSWWVIHSSDRIMIEMLVSASALGLYTVAAKIPSLINVIISIFSQAWGISSVKEIESSNDVTFYRNVFDAYFIFTSMACLLLNTIIKVFMSIYVGDDFFEAWTMVPLLLVSAVFSSVAAYYGSVYGALKKSINNMITTLTAAIVNIIANYIFICKLGAIGAIVGTLISYIVIANFRMIDINRFVKINNKVISYILTCVILLIQAILVTMNYHILIVSMVSFVLFVLVNGRKIIEILRLTFNKLFKKKV